MSTKTASFIFRLLSVLALFIMMINTPVRAAGILYAKPSASGTGNCLSWATACTLQTALTTAVSGDEIWVAAGKHKPTMGTDRNATFQLKSGVAVYGGFAGTETARDQRIPMANITTLSGDLNGDDSGFTNNDENVYHVVSGVTGATLDGFTVKGGNANGADPNNSGGGMYNSYSNPTVSNVTFSNNSASTGGGMDNYNSNPILSNVTFSNNSGNLGGGMDNNYGNPILSNVTFSGNSAAYGGGMYNNSGNPTITNVTFSGNTAGWKGGGMENDSYSYPTISNTIFWGNTASTAAAAQMYNDSSIPVISYSVIQNGCPAASTCTNIITTSPLLGSLGNNGGFTQTIPLLSGSSAINAGNDITCAATDQRGVTRPQGLHCDIGSYEYFVPIFVDVPFSYWANSWIERLYNAGVTGGCLTTPLSYCPDNTVTRAQMAIFLLKGIHTSVYTPPAVGTSSGFTDVSLDYWAAAWIKQLAAEGITGGCGTEIYCPDATVTRAQMAVFLLRAKHGSAYSPANATGVFTDVPVGYWADKWIEQLASEGITSGCGVSTYCPDSSVTRAQMAVFLVKTFNLP